MSGRRRHGERSRRAASPVRFALLALAALVANGPAPAAEVGMRLLVQGPGLAEQGRALAGHLSRRVGASFRLLVSEHALDHWIRVRRDGGAELVIDEAHFADYRAGAFSYRVIARVAGTRSFHLLARRSEGVRDLEDLWAKPVASAPAPSLAALQLLDLFDHPLRVPILHVADSHRQALALLAAGEVGAAFVPVEWRSTEAEFAVVLEGEEAPGMALSLSPRVSPETEAAIRDALLGTLAPGPRSGAGAPVSGLRFEAADTEHYAGYARLLRGTFGYLGR